ncbi:Serine/threonine-protein kinase PrkC [Enhygromyxa salina]|uniref:Serine/threonine-protein kinase PrkC n=2 Tax=Enhygromyxa salina TaxID=215803 RepID=A0A2S9YE41_9BACT|nr:Serine/threonine-protein kinase PrkC [Enhygromyxa salina]
MHSGAGPEKQSEAAKLRLFGDDASDHLRKQVIKARFLRGLRQPTRGLETKEQREGATEPGTDVLSVQPMRIDRFTVLRKLGEGGMGVVYAAYDEQLDRKVALKLLRRELVEDERGRARMQREAQALARLSHPNVVQIHQIGQWGEHDYVAMEFVDGQTLRCWLEAKDRSWREILDVMIQAGRGLAAAHAAGLVHRDFKPANLLVGADGRPRVLDFGLARAADEPGVSRVPELLETGEQRVETRSEPTKVSLGVSLETLRGDISGTTSSAFDQLLTVTGAVLGTPAYMAPEQHLGKRATERSDQFSFCLVLYEALFDERPYKATSRNEYAVQVMEGELAPPPSNSGVPGWLRQVVGRGLATRPEDRWPSMDALLAELERDRARAWKRGAVAAGLVATIGVALAIGSSEEPVEVCQLDRSSVADSWGEDDRSQLRASFEATGLEVGLILDQTERALDTYADELVEARRGACEQRWVEQVQTDAQLELRMACLEQREGELRAVVGVLRDADREVVRHASELLGGLGAVGMCARVDRLERNTPVPKDERTATAIAAAREDIARAHAARVSGQLERSQGLAATLRRRASQLDYEPLLGEVAYLEGRNLTDAQAYGAARDALVEAAGVAVRNNDPELSTAVWLQLATLVAISGEDTDPGTSAEFVMAEAGVTLLDDRPADRFRLHAARGLAFEAGGKAEVALAEFDEAVRLADAGFPASEHQLVWALRSRASAAASLGRYEQARRDLSRALSSSALGIDGPEVVDVTFDLAVTELEHGDYDDAARHLQDALAGYERHYGPRYVTIAHGRLALAHIALERGRVGEAEALIEQALDILDESHEDHAWALDAAAELQMSHGSFTAAVELLERAVEHVQRVAPGAESDLGYRHGRLGTALARSSRYDEALAELDRALALLNPATLVTVEPLLERGRVRLTLDQPLLALASLEQAVALTPADCGDPELAAKARIELARTLWEIGHHDRQVELAAEAVQLLEDIPEAGSDLALARKLMTH